MISISYIKQGLTTLMNAGLVWMVLFHTGNAQVKRFEVSLGGQRMAQFNHGHIKGSTEEWVFYGDELLVRYNFDVGISALLARKHTFSVGMGSMDIGRTIGGGSNTFVQDIPCEANLYAHLNLYGLYTYDMLEFRKWTFQTSLGAQYWSYREKYKNYIPIRQKTWACVTKLGIQREVLKNISVIFNALYILTFDNIFINTSDVSYIPTIFGLETRVGWRF